MEFEKSTPITTEDIARSEIPRLTIEPVHTSIKPETTNTPNSINDEAKQSFSFETESTTSLVTQDTPGERSYTLLIVILSLTAVAAVLAALYLFLPR